MVMRIHQNHSLEGYQSIVKSLYRFQIEMISRRIEQQYIRIIQHHPGDHTTHFFPSGQYGCLFEQLFSREEHTTEKAFEIQLAGVL